MIDIQRSAIPPASLATTNDYNGADVIDALHRDFLGKCYLCETPVRKGTFSIDHRTPIGEQRFRALRCAWTNLCPTCFLHNCNGRRKKKYPAGGLLDPGQGIEARVDQRLAHPSAVLAGIHTRFAFTAAQARDTAAVNTAAELDRIHNGVGSSPPARQTAEALRAAILVYVPLVAQKVMEFERSAAGSAERATLAADLGRLLSRQAPYTMLVRSQFLNKPAVCALFD